MNLINNALRKAEYRRLRGLEDLVCMLSNEAHKTGNHTGFETYNDMYWKIVEKEDNLAKDIEGPLLFTVLDKIILFFFDKR